MTSLKRHFPADDNFEDCTEAYGDGVDAYEGSITFDIINDFDCIAPSGHQYNVIAGPKAIKDGIPLCIHCFGRFKP